MAVGLEDPRGLSDRSIERLVASRVRPTKTKSVDGASTESLQSSPRR
jgi:hypothetical protein